MAPVAPEGGEPAQRLLKGVEALGGERESEGSASEPTLRARDVFEAFIQKLDLTAPQLTTEPLDFFLGHLERNLDPEDASGRLYLIREVLERVRIGMELERSSRVGDSVAQQEATEALRRVSDAVRRSVYTVAAKVASKIDVSVLGENQRKELDEALRAVYLALAESDPQLGLEVCEIWNRLAEVALANGSPDREAWLTSAARALRGKGYCLQKLGRLEAAAEEFSILVQRFGDVPEGSFRVRVAAALVNKSVVLLDAGKPEAAFDASLELAKRFGDSPEPALREALAKALFNQGVALDIMGKPEAALEAWSEVVHRFGDSPEPALRETVARAFINQGTLLASAGKSEAARKAYLQVVQCFGDASEPPLRELVDRARILRFEI